MRGRLYLFMALLVSLSVWAEKPYTLVIDPGHGGKDAGAVGKTSMEKDLNLKLALKVGDLVKAQYPDVNLVYTRSTDVFIPLQTRADIANKSDADLFISIHTNSAENKSAHGVETFILGTDKMEKNLDVAMRENAVMKLEADYKTTYQGFDPNSIDSYIMFELMQNSYMDQSLRFATLVQNRFVGNLNRGDRGVRQAAFWVLLKTACPSILFEMGFISNPDEEKFLNKEGTLDKMAEALVEAFGTYTHKQKAKAQAKEEPAASNKTETSVVQKCGYAVQICASRTELAPSDPKLKGQPCGSIQTGEWYKYYVGPYDSKEAAQRKQKELKTLFPDCWVIEIKN